MSEIKYRHPLDQSLTWSGRGRAPKWYDYALDHGFAEADLMIENQQLVASTAAEIDLGIGDTETRNMNERLDVLTDQVNAAPLSTSVVVVAGDNTSTDVEADQIRLSEWVGQRKFSASLQKLLTVSDLVELQKIKDSKAYRGLRVIGLDGKPQTVSSFSGLCDSIGTSEQHVNEQLLNLRTFGPEFLSFADQSIGYREMRQLRKLPSDQREALAQIATTGSKEDVLEAAYDAIEAERKKADELVVRNAELGEDLKLAERRAKNLDTECERKDIQIKRLSESKKRTTDFLLRTEELREECMALQLGAELHLNSLKRLFEETDPQAPEGTLQMEQLWVIANTLAARTLDLLDFMKARVPDGMPDRPMTRHMLTPEEAIRWLQDYPLIENRFAAEAAVRESRRESARPKGPGRPKGSTNKAAEE